VTNYISVKVLTVRELFSGAYTFHLPWFQRAYAWHTAEVGRLLTNVVEAMNAEPSRYFLGKIMLAKRNGNADTALVDGHQRVMTLTLLYAVLRDLETDEDQRAKLHRFIAHSHLHLQPQHALAEFVRSYVQEPGATLREPDSAPSDLSETQRNIIENRDYLRSQLAAGIDGAARRNLATFLADSCNILKCAVEDEDEAWRILQIEEDTRVEFTPTDRAKASLLSIVPDNQRARCQQLWEQSEGLLGAADLHALLQHLRVLRLRTLSDKPVEADLARAHAMDTQGLAFIEQDLTPAAMLVARIRAGTIGAPATQSAIAAHVRQMSWIDANYWMPAALNWLLRRNEKDADTLVFFRLLERLVWFMRLSGADPVKRQRHILRLLGEMDKGGAAASLRELDISKSMRDAALENLRSPTFDSKHYATRLLRRVSAALGQDPGPTHASRLTLEHILPRSFLPGSPWRSAFPTRKAVQGNAHRLGNLTFLTATDNQAADTLDWTAKRRILAASEFVLSKRAGSARAWTPESISDRTDELIAILLRDWQVS
jgi:hypothetical protein